MKALSFRHLGFWPKILFSLLILNSVLVAEKLFDPDVHVFGTQTYLHSSRYNYLIDDAKGGTLDFSEVGANFSQTFLDNRLFVGAQVLGRKYGPNAFSTIVDWGHLSYSFSDAFKLSLGQNRMMLGFHNSHRDIDSARSSVLAPQEVYPEKNRELMFSTLGFQVSGLVDLSEAGSISYHLGYGRSKFDESLLFMEIMNQRLHPLSTVVDPDRSYLGTTGLHWNHGPWHLGVSAADLDFSLNFSHHVPPTPIHPLHMDFDGRLYQLSFKYEFFDWILSAEHVHFSQATQLHLPIGTLNQVSGGYRGWYTGLEYFWTDTISSHLKYGYAIENDSPPIKSHDYNIGFSFHFLDHFNVKTEYHYLKGAIHSWEFQDLTKTLTDETWHALVVRMGFNY